ncbi:hypothetical protein AN189_10750 [Loktanella sp. 3ANDIMAR09]|uniref:DUF3618 domain-containing protein n=1 Tax=Loktanella sp. 3ANDIMAR09 TaxID=1225657 RepID=UPI0006F53B4B|nr:DUF3618 domain-containing protein [Loktanella sp. 3ANDIMAR09]KQI68288.1 hypothetical protein AN189_10750 [Loktanella sp. 3ANDIMAR09]
MTADNRTPAEIEKEIEAERARLTRDLDALQDRLTVDGLMDEVRQQVRSQIDELQRSLRGQVVEVTGAVGAELRTQLTRAGTTVARTTRKNPWPLAVTGLGLAWLAYSALKPEPKRRVGYAPTKSAPVRGVTDYDLSPADMAAAELERDADRWARDTAALDDAATPTYDPRPSWARADDELTTRSNAGATERN